jgi:CBS domain-containing protein
MPRVKDILKERELFFVEPDETVAEVARKMVDHNVGATLVLENGQLRGIFSERDLMRRIVVGHLDPARTEVGSVMSADVITIQDTDTIEEAMARMKAHSCRHLPVMRDTQVVGFLSMRDLMNYELDLKTDELQHMRAYIHGTR